MTAALSLIESLERERASVLRDPRRHAQLKRLQGWQVQRLLRTYADCAADARYADALGFFVQDLYGPHDFGQRDRSLKKVLNQWERLLSRRGIESVICALELEALTQSLDLAMIDVLGGAEPTEVTYAAAYRQANRRDDRQRQIWLIVTSGRALDGLIKVPAIGVALRMARLPARIAGVTQLHEFLERGYTAFEKMGSAQDLLQIIEQRETAIMQRLFAGSVDPFQFAGKQRAGRIS